MQLQRCTSKMECVAVYNLNMPSWHQAQTNQPPPYRGTKSGLHQGFPKRVIEKGTRTDRYRHLNGYRLDWWCD